MQLLTPMPQGLRNVLLSLLKTASMNTQKKVLGIL